MPEARPAPPSVKPSPLAGRVAIGIDCESHLITPGRNCPRLVCVTLAGKGKPPAAVQVVADAFPDDSMVNITSERWTALFGREPGVMVFRALINDPAVVLIAHNAVFDLSVLAEADPQRTLLADVFEALKDGSTHAQVKCTRIREWLLANALGRLDFDTRINKRKPGYSLADCVKAHFGHDLTDVKKGPDAWRLRYHELDGQPVTLWPEAAQHYAVEDAVWALDVADAQSGFLQADNGGLVAYEDGAIVDENYQLRADWALRLMSCWGPRTDAPRVETWRAELQASVDHADRAAEAAGFVVNGSRKMDKLRAIVDAAYKGNAPKTNTGKTSTAREVLLGSGHPALIAYAEAGFDRKNLTTYLPILLKGVHHPLTSRPNVLVRSGRTSWSKPSLQTGPKNGDYRKSFLARPGKVYVACDYDRIELAALGQIHYWMFGTSAIRDAFIAGEDLHLSLAAELLNITYSEAEKRYAAGDEEVERVRSGAKIANFGFPGGLVARTFVDYAAAFGVEISPGRAQEIHDAWFRRWPEMVPYFERIQQLTKWGDATIEQWVSGRQRHGCKYNVAANTWFQGLTADGAKRALFRLAEECYVDRGTALFGVRPWVFIHDENIAEGPLHNLDAWATRMSEIMVECMQEVIPDVPIGAQPAAMLRWYKNAKPVRDCNGNLIPWVPE